MTDFVGRAHSFVAANYPQADAAFLGGSAASGESTESSDLDILVLLPDEWSSTSFVETTTYEGQLVEAFVYGRGALRSWLEKGRDESRPVLDRLIAHGVSLVEGEIAEDLVASSRRVLDAGPAPIDAEQLNRRRYSLSALVDDVADAADLGVRNVVSWAAWKEAAELAQLWTGRWVGTGKWLLRELRAHGDPFDLAVWVDQGGRDTDALLKSCRSLLDSVGGHLQAGYVRGEKPHLL
ncbi:nucleotidyltransferase domain-containing protein [Ornithinimicrobium faecis]|uniref:Nucleotidyltransferase domain-containing protein n=1 Tax=Ornithinimicrobium faecis TaxID=2934158 RepID=A0ABY4YW61_9MICO|nr:nucleotidyltransferase domain-containing protein [Ornithinimicrobium sp. HY1793]USQ80978.1 nucleotidyltransferase domain-containing protein [Ornithinimicrobium sp. HY1793]